MSRSWLYRQDELHCQIDSYATPGQPRRLQPLPAAEHATVDCPGQQLRAYRSEIAGLRLENQALREQLVHHLGAQRAAANTRPG